MNIRPLYGLGVNKLKLERNIVAVSGPMSLKTDRTQNTVYGRVGKRCFDILLAIALLPLLLPIIFVLWALVKRDGAAGIFGHRRVGKDGKLFTCYKVRTMVPNAEAKLDAYLIANPAAAAEWEATQKLSDDPRITQLGQFLRKTSLDELPQIFNVLKGDMSFVGPRPVTEPELAKYGVYQSTYLSLKPGITGVWQVEGRQDGDYIERVKMDRRYANSLSILRDLSLIARTAVVVARPTGR